jgi:class 3 adenylate cyclase
MGKGSFVKRNSSLTGALRPLLIDEYTREGLSDSFKVEDLGKIVFKGKNQAVNVFAVVEG